jgi:hypothetical protein
MKDTRTQFDKSSIRGKREKAEVESLTMIEVTQVEEREG